MGTIRRRGRPRKRWEACENGCIAGRNARKRRIAELQAERQEIDAELGKVQTTGRLSKLNDRVAEIVKEIEQLQAK
jgi:hypothetical protein